jgi:glycosidase
MQPAFKHNLQTTLDFPLSYAMMDAINQPFGWTNGVNKLYMTLSQDFLYKAPHKNWIFLENHDMERFVSVIGEDMNKYKMGMNLLFTLRGTPHFYYGTEVFMKNFKDPNDGMVRLNFPGGFNDGQTNKFIETGRKDKEQIAFDYVKKLANYRKQHAALQTGKLMQWIPKDGLYVYFRYDAAQTFMIVLNTGKEMKEVNFNQYKERTSSFSKALDIMNNKQYGSIFSIAPKESLVLLLQ